MVPLLLVLAACVSALLPVPQDRFIAGDSVKVSQYFEEPTTQKGTTIKLSVVKSSSSSSSSSSAVQVLNLSPGISLLHTDANNECYFVNTTIGTDVFQLIIDTGSAYLWVYGDECTDEPCQNEPLYTPASGHTSSTSTSTFALAYVTGTASGKVVEDNIIVNKLATTQKFRFGMADTVPSFFSRYPVSGIFGLPSNDSSSIESIISALYNSHAISKKRFSISLGQVGSNSTGDYTNSGVFAIGDPVSQLYVSDIHYIPLLDSSDTYWRIPIEQISVGNNVVQFNETEYVNGGNSTTARVGIVDSGTTVLALPEQDALDLHSYFSDSITDGTNFAILCNTTLDIELQLNGKNWTLTPDKFLGDAYSQDSVHYGYCVSNIQGVAQMESWILGAVFLKTVYADFDLEDQRVGFATRNENIILTSTSTSEPSSTGYYSNNTVTMSTFSSTAIQSSSSKADGIALGVSVSGLVLSFCALLL
jgi:hypothetical protein